MIVKKWVIVDNASMRDNPTRPSEDQEFKNLDFSKNTLERQTFTNYTFICCNFSETILRYAQFCSCTFKSCNLSLIKLDGCRFQDVQCIECKIVGAEFFKCDRTFFSLSFKNCLLRYCNFSNLKMKQAHFNSSELKECYFTDNDLSGAHFDSVNLAGTTFHNCDLSRADLSTATNYAINPISNKIAKAKFSLPEAVSLLSSFDITLI